MPLMLVFDSHESEIRFLQEQIAYLDKAKEEILFYSASNIQELMLRVHELDSVSVYCSDFDTGGEAAIRIVKDNNPDVVTVIIVDSHTSPVKYVRPFINASGVLLRPFSKEQIICMLKEVLDAVWTKEREKLFRNEVFVASTREEIIRVPYAKILFFEARSKKICLCTRRNEYSFYASLESLSSQLPDYFLRCHKGFIVNKLLVDKVDLTQKQLYLLGGYIVPISRSYWSAVKAVLA